MKTTKSDLFPKQLLHPRQWGAWFIAGLLFILVKVLPYRVLMCLGAGLGLVMEKLMPYRMLVSRTNIELCFADRDWQSIYRAHVKSIGKGVFEMAMGWFLSPNYFVARVKTTGHEDTDKALAEGRGVLFLGVHTTGLDFGAPILNSRHRAYFMYQQAKNPVLDYLIKRGRERCSPGVIARDNIRSVMTCLKNGECVWYGCDQDFGNNAKSVFAPFYGVSAYTLPYYAKIAQKTGAAVIPVVGLRDEKTGRFLARYLPEIDVKNLSEEQAATKMNQAIEQLIIGYEDQYYWVHRRFKTRPDGEKAIYPPKPSHVRRERRKMKQAAKVHEK